MHADRSPLHQVCAVFLKLGLTAFGGPVAHVSAMEDEIVTRRGWMTRGEFTDRLSVANMLPGPNSTELALSIGLARAGWPGLLAAGACFILPAVIVVWLLAWLYVRQSGGGMFGGVLPAVLAGMQPVVLAVIAQAVWRLGRTVLHGWQPIATFAVSLTALALGAPELVVLVGAAACSALLASARPATRPLVLAAPATQCTPGVVYAPSAAAIVAGAGLASTSAVFVSFLKIGSLLFGSGYVLLAFLRAEFVDRHHWLSETQLLDAIAVGQVTPGPLFSSATFVGYLLAGHSGAAAATVGIFLPAFLFVAASAPLVRWLRGSAGARAALDGVNAASLALLAAAALPSARAVTASLPGAVIFSVAALVLVLTRVTSAWLLLAGAVTGLLALRLPILLG